jgi:hypothetical protein
MDQCLHHEAVDNRLSTTEKDVDHLWDAIREVRDDIKKLIGKIGWIVGTITVVNSIVMVMVEFAIRKP